MIRTRGRRLVSRLEALERVYDTRGPRVFRVIFEYGGEPTIVTIFRDENRTEIIEPPPPDDDPDEFYGAGESTEALDVAPAPQPADETPSSFPVGANASLSIRRGTACRAHSPTRSRNGLRPFRAARVSKRSSHAIPHRGDLRHTRTSRARETEPQPKRPAPLPSRARQQAVQSCHTTPREPTSCEDLASSRTQPAAETTRAPSEPRASASGPVMPCHTVGTYVTRRPRKLAKLSRSRNGLRPFRAARVSKRSSHAIPHRGDLRHTRTSRARETEPQPKRPAPLPSRARQQAVQSCHTTPREPTSCEDLASSRNRAAAVSPPGPPPRTEQSRARQGAGLRPRLCAVMFSKLTVELASETWVRCGISGATRLPTAVSRPLPRCRQ